MRLRLTVCDHFYSENLPETRCTTLLLNISIRKKHNFLSDEFLSKCFYLTPQYRTLHVSQTVKSKVFGYQSQCSKLNASMHTVTNVEIKAKGKLKHFT